MINIIDVVVYEKRTFTGFRTVDRLHAFAIDPAEIDSLINLKGVVVSANKIHVNRNSVPLSISVIEREEIELAVNRRCFLYYRSMCRDYL